MYFYFIDNNNSKQICCLLFKAPEQRSNSKVAEFGKICIIKISVSHCMFFLAFFWISLAFDRY